MSPCKSTDKLIPSKSSDKLMIPKETENTTAFPLANRKDYIKQKIQNMKQKNEAQYRLYQPARLK